MTKVSLVTGYGSEPWAKPEVEVAYFAEYPRGEDGTCAFCAGDPCNEYSPPTSIIAEFYRNASNAATCPVCDGRPT